METNYFKEVVLPSVGLPYKGSYSLPESCRILGCSRTKLWQMGIKEELVIAPNKKVYCRDFENYFNSGSTSRQLIDGKTP